jgi:hypothetical protein
MVLTERRTIDGHEYAISQLPARRGGEMFFRLGGILSPAILELISRGISLDVDAMDLAPVFLRLFSAMPDGEFTKLTEKLLETALRDGHPMLPTLDLDFAGEIFSLLKVLAFSVEVNFRDFQNAFAAAAAAKKAAEEAAKAKESAA